MAPIVACVRLPAGSTVALMRRRLHGWIGQQRFSAVIVVLSSTLALGGCSGSPTPPDPGPSPNPTPVSVAVSLSQAAIVGGGVVQGAVTVSGALSGTVSLSCSSSLVVISPSTIPISSTYTSSAFTVTTSSVATPTSVTLVTVYDAGCSISRVCTGAPVLTTLLITPR